MNANTRNILKWLCILVLMCCGMLFVIYIAHNHLHHNQKDSSTYQESSQISPTVETLNIVERDVTLQPIEEYSYEVTTETFIETLVEEPQVLIVLEPEVTSDAEVASEAVPESLPNIIKTIEVRLFNDHKLDFNLIDGRAYLDVVSIYLHKYAPEGMYLSAALAQAYTEGGAGKAGVYTLTNNCFGITATPSWEGYVFSRTTQLVYKDYSTAKAYGATDLFRAYDSIEDSVIDYVSLIQTERYDEALFTTSPKEYLSHLLNNGYGEKESLYVWMEMIDLYDLHEVDSLRETEDVQLFVS